MRVEALSVVMAALPVVALVALHLYHRRYRRRATR